MATTSRKPSLLVAAAAALDEELRAYDDLADESRSTSVNSEKALQRAIRLVKDSAARNDAIQEKLRALVSEIESARARQVESLNTLVDAARSVQSRAEQHDALMKRFSELGEAAQNVNAMTLELSVRRSQGATETELLDGLRIIQAGMGGVVADAEALAAIAKEQDWLEFARQADAVRQQVLAAKNKLALAQQSVATRAPS